MEIKREAILFSILVGLLCAAANAGVDRIYNYNDGAGWKTETIRTDDVAAIVNDWDSTQLNVVYCAVRNSGHVANKGFDRAYKLGYAWNINTPLIWNYGDNTNNYTALARYYDNSFSFAAVAGGGMERVFSAYWADGQWRNQPMTDAAGNPFTHTFNILADAGPLNKEMCYVVASGIGLERVFFATYWREQLMSATEYVNIAASLDGYSMDMVYGVRPDGGIDRVFLPDSEWRVQEMMPAGSGYVAVADRSGTSQCFAAGSNGLDIIYLSGTWQAGRINNNQYVALISDPCTPFIVYGARKAGGVDYIHSDDGGTTWTTDAISTGKKYTSIIYQKNNQPTITYGDWSWAGGDISVYGLYPKCDSLSGDINHDCHVDFGDIGLLAGEWLQSGL